MLLNYCKVIKLYNLLKVKENVSEIKKLKGSRLLFISFTDVYRKKRGRFIGHENIGVYKFYPKHVEDNIK